MVIMEGAGEVLADHEAVLGGRHRRGQRPPYADRAVALDQPAPGLDRPGHGDRCGAPLGHRLETALAHCGDGGGGARAAGTLQPQRDRVAGRPDQREEVAADRGHVRVDDAEDGVRGDRGVDRVAALAQHLGARLRGQPVRAGDDAFHAGVRNRRALGSSSNTAGSSPTTSPSSCTRTGTGELTSTRVA